MSEKKIEVLKFSQGETCLVKIFSWTFRKQKQHYPRNVPSVKWMQFWHFFWILINKPPYFFSMSQEMQKKSSFFGKISFSWSYWNGGIKYSFTSLVKNFLLKNWRLFNPCPKRIRKFSNFLQFWFSWNCSYKQVVCSSDILAIKFLPKSQNTSLNQYPRMIERNIFFKKNSASSFF